ncbi:sialate O-acetylesterase [Zobellia sp. OII3]|uniref:sialate O-acetylesterase n=1 Tax=Zobellia sp. OII3 TaxID=2034520 RepID=UPI000B52C611|nr:sialate O-acetylesterase [Zobellia sp. OII3]OWW24672.1 sialate O-acetylesterase [Zobellia sp. OII3]
MRTRSLVLILFVFTSLKGFTQDPNFHIYLCFGQSNMEGSASIEPEDLIVSSRFKLMPSTDCKAVGKQKGFWYTAIPPLSQCGAGLSPADYFGRTMIQKLPDSISVGVINVAIGGCDIRLFDKEIYGDYTETYKESWFTDKIKAYGGNPYERLITMAKQAQKTGVIKGILLHQGETNQDDKNWPQYVKKVYRNMLEDLGLKAENVPLLAGEVVGEDQGGVCASMNKIINILPQTIPTAHIVSSKGCTVREDHVHFDSDGVRELGKRYAEKMWTLEQGE